MYYGHPRDIGISTLYDILLNIPEASLGYRRTEIGYPADIHCCEGMFGSVRVDDDIFSKVNHD